MRKPLPLLEHARQLIGDGYGPRLPMLASASAQQHLWRNVLDALPDRFSELSSGARREAVAAWAIQLVAAHGADEATRVVGDHVERIAAVLEQDRERVARDREAAKTQRSTVGPPNPVTTASSYVVRCATGCGHWLPAAGPRPVVARTRGCDRPAGAVRRAKRAERRREKNA